MAAEPSPSTPPPTAQPPVPVSTRPATTLAALIGKTVTEITALVFVGVLALTGRLPAEWALGALLLLAGVRVADILAFKSGPPGSGSGGMGGMVGLALALVHGAGTILHRIGGGPAAMVLLAAGALGVATTDGCSGVQVTGQGTVGVSTAPGGEWVASVEIGVQITRTALPAVAAVIAARGEIPAATQRDIAQGFHVAEDSLDLVTTGIRTYLAAPSVESRCQVHFYVARALEATLQALALVGDSGVSIDPAIQTAVGGLGVMDDMLFPGCGGPPDGGHARTTSAQERVHAAAGRWHR